MSKVLRIFATTMVIRQLERLILLEHDVLLRKRYEFIKLIDAILTRASTPICGIEVLLQILEVFSNDNEMVDLIFQVFVTLMYGDKKHNVNKDGKQYRTARRIHLNGSKDLINDLLNVYIDNEDIRVSGKNILGDLIKAKSHAAMEALRQVKEAVESNISFETYATINPSIIVPKKRLNVEHCIRPDEERKIFQEVPGSMGIDIVLSNMLNFANNENVQLMGFDTILQCLYQHNNDSKSCMSIFSNDRCATVLVRALMGQKKFKVRWRVHAVLMKLTSHNEMCKYMESQGGCKAILDVLKEPCLEVSVHQMALWSLSNLCRVDNCLQVLVQLGLKSMLHKIITKEGTPDIDKDTIVPPLSLRTLYPKSVLEDASRFELLPTQINHKEGSHSNSSEVPRILPLPKGARPFHGTAKQLFDDGCPGLI